MAKVLGDPGRYVSQQAVQKHRRFVLAAFIGFAVISFIFGIFTCYDFEVQKNSLAAGILLPTIFLLSAVLTERVVSRQMSKFEAERMHYLKGATGEQAVARKLDDLPDEYRVIHDLATPFGNLDHVVIGPTGVFILETKNWKGIITADGKDGILLNNHRFRDAIKPLIVRMMNVRKKIIALCDAGNNFPYFNAVLVFPSARVEARWGQTGRVRCISDEHIWNCIVDARHERKLASAETDRLAQAFGALASMDKEFSSKPQLRSPSTSLPNPGRRCESVKK